MTLKTVNQKSTPIIFSQWSSLGGNRIKRKDFYYESILKQESSEGLKLFSDLGVEQYIPKPEKNYKPFHFLKISDVESS